MQEKFQEGKSTRQAKKKKIKPSFKIPRDRKEEYVDNIDGLRWGNQGGTRHDSVQSGPPRRKRSLGAGQDRKKRKTGTRTILP